MVHHHLEGVDYSACTMGTRCCPAANIDFRQVLVLNVDLYSRILQISTLTIFDACLAFSHSRFSIQASHRHRGSICDAAKAFNIEQSVRFIQRSPYKQAHIRTGIRVSDLRNQTRRLWSPKELLR
ncbi:hypothetical protein GOBAR_DD07166 [Gossypium barbadense]|nr:hypothetical protein GOBAR_DD07166 [Gossypium barbadense]